MSRPTSSRQQSHTPLQQHFDGSNNLHNGFPQNQALARPARQAPLHRPNHQQQQQPQQQPSYPAADQPFAPPTNGQPEHYPVGPHSHLAYPQFQGQAAQSQLQQARFQQLGFVPQKQNTFQQSASGSVGAVPVDEQQTRQPQAVGLHSSSSIGHAQPALSQHSALENDQGGEQSSAKKRKRTSRSASEMTNAESTAAVGSDLLMGDAAARKSEEVVSLQAPKPSAEEASLLAELAKRTKPAQRKLPSAKALPFLAPCGTIKLPGKTRR